MQGIGVTRGVDALGRVVLPKELRRTLGIEPGQPMEILVDGNAVVLRKYAPGCVFCGEVGEVAEFRRQPVCGRCRQELASA